MRTKTIIAVVISGALLVLVFIGYVTYANRADQANRSLVREVESERRPVQTVVVSPQRLVEYLSSTGVLQAAQDVVVTSEVAGRVEKVFRKLGDPCKKGQVIARLDGEGYQIALAQAEAALKQSRVALDHADRDLSRMNALKESAVATAQQLDAAEGAKSSQAAAVDQAEAAQRLAARNLREASVRCPFSGHVAALHVDTGSSVMPQTPVARLVDTSRLSLVLSVTSGEIGRIKPGQQVKITDPSGPGREFEGKVTRLGVAADAMTRTFPVEVSVETGKNELRAGQVVHVSLELQVFEDVMALPSQAIRKDPLEGSVQVLVVNQGTVQMKRVVIGPQIEDLVIVQSGINTGDEVVTVGGDDLENGFPVEVRKQERQAGTVSEEKAAPTPDNDKKTSR